jgi:hypothetical protein
MSRTCWCLLFLWVACLSSNRTLHLLSLSLSRSLSLSLSLSLALSHSHPPQVFPRIRVEAVAPIAPETLIDPQSCDLRYLLLIEVRARDRICCMSLALFFLPLPLFPSRSHAHTHTLSLSLFLSPCSPRLV